MHVLFSRLGVLASLLLAGASPPLFAASPVVLHSFDAADSQTGSNTGGAFPFSGVTQGANGDWYGTTISGGPSGAGTLFRTHSDGTGFTVVKTFESANTAADGGYPVSPLTRGLDGSLYGTTSNGGANSDKISSPGTIFRISPTGQFQTIHSLPADDADGQGGGGEVSQASDGILYGCFDSSGGYLYKMNPDGTGYQTIHTFPALADGASARGSSGGLAPVEGSDGLLYSVYLKGGAHGGGIVYRIAKDGTGYTVLHDFDAAAAGSVTPGPSSRLLKGLDGAFYGVTSATGANGTGSVYRIDMAGNFQTLVSFPALGTGGINTVGASPVDGNGLTQGPDGTLYGVTYKGGANGVGTLYSVRPEGSGLTDLLDFKNSDIGTLPPAFYSNTTDTGFRFKVAFGSSGLLYVTTDGGGVNGTGAVLSLAPSGITHVLWTNTNGAASIWNYDTLAGTFAHQEYGPYTDYTAKAIADGGTDGKVRVLWDNADGSASIWSLDNSTGTLTHAEFGPYAGYTASALSVSTDNTTHILWKNTNGSASIWNYSTASSTFTHQEYGPYTGYTPKTIADSPDGKLRVLWTKSDGTASIWSLDNSTGAFTHAEFGPYAGYMANALSVGTDNTTHLLWNNVSGAASLWNYSTANSTFTHQEYGPYAGYSAQAIADASADGKTRVLWDKTDGTLSLWGLDNTAAVFTHFEFGPYGGWTALGVSAP